MSKSRFAIVACFAALIFWIPVQQSVLAQETQKEMQKFTEEKNRALRVQITVFAVLNVVALGVVYTAYNQMR